MIVTIDDYRSDAAASNKRAQPKGDDSRFTVANAGHLKAKLQALSSILSRTPPDRHGQLCFEDILQSAPPRTYVNGAEDMYFKVKYLSWPSKIPEVFVNAYSEVVNSRPFTNRYNSKPVTPEEIKYLAPTSTVFAPTFSAIRPLLPGIDALCSTSLSEHFEEADKKWNPFPFMRLPVELRLQVYDHLVPNEPFVRVRPREAYKYLSYPPIHLDIMRVSRGLYAETTKHFYNKSTVLIQACYQPRVSRDRAYWTMHNVAECANFFMSMKSEVKHTFTRLEIQIVSSIPETEGTVALEATPNTALEQICATLPNLQVVVISFQRAEPLPRGLWESYAHFTGISRTLDWIYARLPDKGLRIAWDLTGFRWPSESAAQTKLNVMAEWTMGELIKRDGSLELERSVTITPEEEQKWLETRDIVLEAFGQSQQT